MAGRKVRVRKPEEGFREDLIQLLRVKSRIDLDRFHDPAKLKEASRHLAAAISLLNEVGTERLGAEAAPTSPVQESQSS